MKNSLTVEDVAMICHAAIKELAHISQIDRVTLWELTPRKDREMMIHSVNYVLDTGTAVVAKTGPDAELFSGIVLSLRERVVR